MPRRHRHAAGVVAAVDAHPPGVVGLDEVGARVCDFREFHVDDALDVGGCVCD